MNNKLIISSIIAVVLIICALIYFNNSDSSYDEKTFEKNSQGQLSNSSQYYDNQQNIGENQNNNQQNNYGKKCTGSGSVKFTSPPMKVDDIMYIQPLGLMIGGHVTPIDHQYYYANSWKPSKATIGELRDVASPADGIVQFVQRMPSEYTTSEIGDYRLQIDHSCTFYSIYIHLNQLSPKLQQIVDKQGYQDIEVKAGEVIGKARSFDFSVHDEQITLKGFINPETYKGESWKIHTVDPFDYFVEPLKTQLLTKNTRTAEPRGGKIDYDLSGKLIGNWFEENTGGYSGYASGTYGYWSTHLAFAPDALDPDHIIASLGNFKGEAKQFGVKGNSPNPAEVDKNAGLIKYELVDYEYLDSSGNKWNQQKFASGLKAKNTDAQIHGTILVQLTETDKIKAEVFPGKSAKEINGFTSNAKIYSR
ncbi:MAG: hypothetical protein Q7R87_03165 [Nanoarchaeota archaeon]|nr:hypothetical protein [Nanoarchaeota archaeon]